MRWRTLLGLALLLAAAPSVRLGVYALGGAYLVWVGARLVRGGLARRRAGDAARDAVDRCSPSAAGGPFLQGVLTRARQCAGAVLPGEHLRQRRPPRRQPGDPARRHRRHRRRQRRLSQPARLAHAARGRARLLRPQPRPRWKSASACCSWRSARGSCCGKWWGGYRREAVMPGLVPGIQTSASAGARGTVDPGDKRRDDRGAYAGSSPAAASGGRRGRGGAGARGGALLLRLALGAGDLLARRLVDDLHGEAHLAAVVEAQAA